VVGYRVLFGDDEEVPKMNGGDGGKAVWTYLVSLNCALKIAKMITSICVFYHNRGEPLTWMTWNENGTMKCWIISFEKLTGKNICLQSRWRKGGMQEGREGGRKESRS
jgi:hypothetical protein